MKIREFLKEKQLSVGDNALFLLRELFDDYEPILHSLESRFGETAKMSKSKANVVDPEEAIEKYGADTVRLYILFAAPPEQDFEWTDEGIQGAHRFLNRFWSFAQKTIPLIKDIDCSREDFKNPDEETKNLRRKVHTYYSKYLKDMGQRYQFNTAIATIMELLNTLQDFRAETDTQMKALKEGLEIITLMLSPIAPHICEEVWHLLGKERLIAEESLPQVDEEAVKQEELEIPVQVNGKLRAKVSIPANANEEEVKNIVLSDERVKKYMENKNLKKFIYVKGRLVNLVVA